MPFLIEFFDPHALLLDSLQVARAFFLARTVSIKMAGGKKRCTKGNQKTQKQVPQKEACYAPTKVSHQGSAYFLRSPKTRDTDTFLGTGDRND